MGKRKDHHKQVIQASVPYLEKLGYKVTQFHTAQKMPRPIRGVPDLYIMYNGVSWWVEIKPRYANYMRDQMSTLQWQWYHERREDFGYFLRYTIVEDEDELLNFVLNSGSLPDPDWFSVGIPEYHLGRYEQWRRGR